MTRGLLSLLPGGCLGNKGAADLTPRPIAGGGGDEKGPSEKWNTHFWKLLCVAAQELTLRHGLAIPLRGRCDRRDSPGVAVGDCGLEAGPGVGHGRQRLGPALPPPLHRQDLQPDSVHTQGFLLMSPATQLGPKGPSVCTSKSFLCSLQLRHCPGQSVKRKGDSRWSQNQGWAPGSVELTRPHECGLADVLLSTSVLLFLASFSLFFPSLFFHFHEGNVACMTHDRC